MSNQFTYIIAGTLLVGMFLMAVFSMKDDSLTMDELAHLPAGFSYLTQKDMRLNPEHPPLIKDLAALPLLFIPDLNFPSEIKEWKEDINGQWGFGAHFLYRAGNPADQMIFWGRIPMIFLLILLGVYIFKWARELYGNKVALLALFLFSFSPTFLAHGRLITTDLGAAFGIFIGTYYFLKTLKRPTKKNIILAGIAFGIAQLFKFSVILLVPFFFFLILIFWRVFAKKFKEIFKTLILVFLIGLLLIGVVYQYHIWNYPIDRHLRDTQVFLSGYPTSISSVLILGISQPLLRPLVQYFTGLLMIFHRAAYGHTTFFMGEVSNLGWRHFFPLVYLLKVPLAFHILTLIGLLYAAWLIKKPFWQKTYSRIKSWIKIYFSEFAMILFIVIYWATSLASRLNIGVRHLLPIFPFIILLVSALTISWLKPPFLRLKYILLFGLIFWQAMSVISIYPHFLAYFNEIAGGPNQGYLYTVNSNLDWGQDLKRLARWVEENKIEKIKIAYFGGGDPSYYLGDRVEYFAWEKPQKGWIAVSVTPLQIGRGIPAPGFEGPAGFFHWLDPFTPVTKIGYSIFVYYID